MAWIHAQFFPEIYNNDVKRGVKAIIDMQWR